jgi:uncharacterized protein
MPFDIIQYDNRDENSKLGISLEFNKTKVVSSTITTQKLSITNLKTLLLTKLGERIMQPDFGTALYEIIFEPNTEEISNFISDSIQTAVTKWLPDINIISIDVSTNETDSTLNNQINIKITFNVNTEQINRTISVFVNENGNFSVSNAEVAV